MEKTTKSIFIDNGTLYAVRGESRYKLADCKARIEVCKSVSKLPMIGGTKVDRRYLTVLVTFDNLASNIDERVSLVQFKGEALRQDGFIEELFFNRCLLMSEWDPEMKGECKFEVQCTAEEARKLINEF